MEIIVKTQKEWDALPKSFAEFTVIKIISEEWITVRGVPENSRVEARENSSVEAWGNSRVAAWENSRVAAWENSRVEAWGNSRVEARENSSVEAWGNSRVEAWENSRVEARENSRVEAWENSRVEARENSRVEARGNVLVHNFSPDSNVLLWAYAVAFLFNKAKATTKSKTATIIEPKYKPETKGWLEREGIELADKVILFKRVSQDFKTQEGTSNETHWKIGATLDHPAWNPKQQECGPGKFHACSRPCFCDEFRDHSGDRYIAIEIQRDDLYAWSPPAEYPHKIAFRKGTVLFECNRFGEKI